MTKTKQPKRHGRTARSKNEIRPLREILDSIRSAIKGGQRGKVRRCIEDAEPRNILTSATVTLNAKNRRAIMRARINGVTETIKCNSILAGFDVDLEVNPEFPTITPENIQTTIDDCDNACDTRSLVEIAIGISRDPIRYAAGIKTLTAERPVPNKPPGWRREAADTWNLNRTPAKDDQVGNQINRVLGMAAGSPTLTRILIRDYLLKPDTETIFLTEYSWGRHGRAPIPLADGIRTKDIQLRQEMFQMLKQYPSATASTDTYEPEDPKTMQGIHPLDILIGAALSDNVHVTKLLTERHNGLVNLVGIDRIANQVTGRIQVGASRKSPRAYALPQVQPVTVDLRLQLAIQMITEPIDALLTEQLAELLETEGETNAIICHYGNRVLGTTPDGTKPLIPTEIGKNGKLTEPTSVAYARQALESKPEVCPETPDHDPTKEEPQRPEPSIDKLFEKIVEHARRNERREMHNAIAPLAPCAAPSFRVSRGTDGRVLMVIGENLTDDPLWRTTRCSKPSVVPMVPSQALIITTQRNGMVAPEAIQKAATELEQNGNSKEVEQLAAVLAARPGILDDLGGQEKTTRAGGHSAIAFYRFNNLETVKNYTDKLQASRRKPRTKPPPPKS